MNKYTKCRDPHGLTKETHMNEHYVNGFIKATNKRGVSTEQAKQLLEAKDHKEHPDFFKYVDEYADVMKTAIPSKKPLIRELFTIRSPKLLPVSDDHLGDYTRYHPHLTKYIDNINKNYPAKVYYSDHNWKD